MNSNAENQEQNLKRVLDTKDVLLMAVGLIIGAGVMTLTGIAIGRTGTGVPIAYLIAAIATTVMSVPVAQLGSAAPTAGAGYKYASRLISPMWGFFFIATYIPMFICFAVYALAFSQYFCFLIPAADPYAVAMIILSIMYLINLLGTKQFSAVQNVMVAILALALIAFIIYGLPRVDFNTVFITENILPFGMAGMVNAVALLSFAMAGASYMASMGSEMKNPGRDIPLGIIVGTLGVGVIYALIALVACGVLPWESVAGKSLAEVAREILPTWLLYVFVIGGGLGATATTINANFAYVAKPLISACQDGWLPRKLGRVSKKTGIPSYLLTLFYIVGMIPLILRLSISDIADLCSAAGMIGASVIPIGLIRMMKKRPDLYEKSRFKIPRKLITPLCVFCVILAIFQAVALLSNFSLRYQIIVLVYLVAVLIFGKIRSGKVNNEDDLISADEQS